MSRDHRAHSPIPVARIALAASSSFPGSEPTDPDLDLQNLRCPMPVLRTRRQLARMVSGDRVRVLCTDPLAGIDIPHLLRETGDILLGHAIDGPVQVFAIQKR
jgi:tRNA 2-thiouridine synthesizing protein A